MVKLTKSLKHWLLKCENMGVPQTRHRVFFVATRLDFDLSNIDLTFNYEPITYGDIMTGQHTVESSKIAEVAKLSNEEDKLLKDTMMRLYNKCTYFSERIVYRNKICPTITAGGSDIWIENWGAKINQNEIINAQTFPQDYNYCGKKPKYICGMSVPPIMIKRLMTRLIESGLYNYKLNR